MLNKDDRHDCENSDTWTAARAPIGEVISGHFLIKANFNDFASKFPQV